jgi:hypothetical protein
MFDPCRDPEWIGGAKSVEPPAGDPHRLGARVKRIGGFLGRKFFWVTELAAFEPNRLMRMRFVEGPMKGEVVYAITPEAAGARVSIRNSGGANFAIPGMAWMLRRSVAKDLERLEGLAVRRS